MFKLFRKIIWIKNDKKDITEIDKINHNDYIDYRNYLIRQKHNVSDKESKLLIYLSSWVLSFSFAFIEKDFLSEFLFIIIISWILSISSFILILFSFNLSKESFEKQIEITDIEYKNQKLKGKNNRQEVPKNYFIDKVKKSIFYARLFLIFSIILLFIFYSVNLLKNV